MSVTTQRAVLYVGATRGRESNRLYVVTGPGAHQARNEEWKAMATAEEAALTAMVRWLDLRNAHRFGSSPTRASATSATASATARF